MAAFRHICVCSCITALHDQNQAKNNVRKCRQHSTIDADDFYITRTIRMLKITYNAHNCNNFGIMFHFMTVVHWFSKSCRILNVRTKGFLELSFGTLFFNFV